MVVVVAQVAHLLGRTENADWFADFRMLFDGTDAASRSDSAGGW